MPRPATSLSNCYIPVSKSVLSKSQSKLQTATTTCTKNRQAFLDQLVDSSLRQDDRNLHSLRRLHLESNVLDNNSHDSNGTGGSCLVEFGHTKVLCQVIGPVTSTSEHLPSQQTQLNMDQGTLYVEVKYASTLAYPLDQIAIQETTTVDSSSNTSATTTGRLNQVTSVREHDLSTRLLTALAAAVPLQQYAKTAIVVRVTILQEDGSILPACITAASLALADASVEMYDIVTACTVAVVNVVAPSKEEENNNNKSKKSIYYYLADPTLQEMEWADAVMTLAILPNWKEVTCWELQGLLLPDQANTAMELCRDGCRTMHRFMREHMVTNVANNATTTTTTSTDKMEE